MTDPIKFTESLHHLETLRRYQAWRRDDSSEPRSMDECGLTAKGIGEALDWAIAECAEANTLRAHVVEHVVRETKARKLAQTQLDAEREEKRAWGLHLSAALNGDKRADEPENDARLDAVRAMAVEVKELRAHVERLRNMATDARTALSAADVDCLGVVDETHDTPAYPIRDAIISDLSSVIAETPDQSLAEIRAEAGRQGFLAGWRATGQGLNAEMCFGCEDVSLADEYAAAIRQA
jgi:hypothetical protein